jgi:hypothetical protein
VCDSTLNECDSTPDEYDFTPDECDSTPDEYDFTPGAAHFLHHLPALSAPTLQVSSDFHQFALIFIDLH